MLPKLQQPIFSLNLPLSKKTIKYRPMLVKEEKMLLMAKESKEFTDIINNLEQVIKNCVIDTDIDIGDLPMVEVEYLFLNLRAKSIGNIIELKFYDPHDKKKTHDVSIDADTIKINIPENYNPKIQITDSVGIMLTPPTLNITKNLNLQNDDEVSVGMNLVTRCIKFIYDNDQVYSPADYTPEELQEFIEGLTVETFTKVEQYFNELPTLKHKISYKDTKGEDVNVELTQLEDFF